MGVDYRAVFRLDDDQDAVRVASEQFRSWLRDKRAGFRRGTLTVWDWDGPGKMSVGPGATLNVVVHQGEDGSTRQLLELVEKKKDSSWTTSVYAASSPAARRLKQTLWIITSSSQGTTAKPPRLVRQVLEAVDARDGDVPVLASPEAVGVQDVDRLVGYIVDPYRDLSLVLAAPVDVPIHKWTTAVGDLVKDSMGVSSAFVLDDGAFDELKRRLPDSHGVPAHSVRTYLPRVNLDDPADGRRHRYLGARTMARELGDNLRFSNWLVEAHSRSARQHIAESPLPSELARVESILQRQKLEQARSVGVLAGAERGTEARAANRRPKPRVPATVPAAVRRLADLVRRWTGRDEMDEDAVNALEQRLVDADRSREVSSQQVADLLDERELLNDEVDQLRRELEDEQLDHEVAEEARRELDRHVRTIQHWKSEQQIDDPLPEAGAEFVWEQAPETVAELVLRFDDPEFADVTRFVELTDVEKAYEDAKEIDDRDKVGRYAAAFWEYILVLRDYAIACSNDFGGGVHAYLKSPEVIGRKCPEGRHRPTEGDQVSSNPKFRNPRIFKVPAAVDSSGEIFMDAHFAPTHRDTFAPRLHYHSDVAGTGKVYIGYIGRHLPNTKTN